MSIVYLVSGTFAIKCKDGAQAAVLKKVHRLVGRDQVVSVSLGGMKRWDAGDSVYWQYSEKEGGMLVAAGVPKGGYGPEGKQIHVSDYTEPEKTSSVSLNAKGVAKLREIAQMRGLSLRDYMEALMHFAISQDERPGSWEAQGFDVSSYFGKDGFADRWF